MLKISLLYNILPLLYATIGFGMLITIHECGHFLFCKLFNIHTPTFSIGMGPTIFQKKIGTTNFRLSALPFGGYVEIAGNEEVGQGDQLHAMAEDDTSFKAKPYWQKFLVMMGGIIFNIAFAYIVLSALFMAGVPKSEIRINSFLENSLAQKSGIELKDRIIKINDIDLTDNAENFYHAQSLMQNMKEGIVTFSVLRNGENKLIQINLPEADSLPKTGRLGVEFAFKPSNEIERYSFIESCKKGVKQTNAMIYQTIFGLASMFKKRSLQGTGGPLMIISESVKQAQSGLMYLFIFLALVSINLAIMNLLPLPVLDGGQLLFVSLESLTGKEIPPSIKQIIFIVNWVGLLALILFLSYKDILHIFKI